MAEIDNTTLCDFSLHESLSNKATKMPAKATAAWLPYSFWGRSVAWAETKPDQCFIRPTAVAIVPTGRTARGEQLGRLQSFTPRRGFLAQSQRDGHHGKTGERLGQMD